MSTLLILFPLAVAIVADQPSAPAAPAPAVQNVLLVTYDGLRWQEVFGGADASLIHKTHGGVKDVDALNQRFWRPSPAERREILMPFFWKTIAKQGQVFGSPVDGSTARVTNGLNFSYPGYNELLTGAPDPAINSNAKRLNRNVTVLEWLHRRPGFDGTVAAFGSWNVFPFIINVPRSGIPVNAGWERFRIATDAVRLDVLNELVRESPHLWPDVRFDGLTFMGAVEYLRVKQPRVLYVSFGETDDFAHDRRYHHYLDACQRTDAYVRRLWELMQSMPQYKDKTALVLSTDHGRGGQPHDWTDHGEKTPGSDRIWIAALGPRIAPLGARKSVQVTQSQIAGTIAALLGEDFNSAFPKAAPPLPDVVRSSARKK